MKAKVNFGLGHPVNKILKFTNELAEELHKSVSTNFERRQVNVNGIDEFWAADLIDLQALSKDNKRIKYLLTVIVVFSKFVWIISIKQKTGKKIAEALFKNL